MKTKSWLLLLSIIFIFAALPAQAHYIWFDPSGQATAAPGETVSVDIYMHADTDDIIYGWGLNMGFDDALTNNGELEYVSFTYGEKTLAAHQADEAGGYLAGTSLLSAGDSVVHAGRYDWNFEGDALATGEDYLLFSIDFAYGDGELNGDDIWVEWAHTPPYGSYFDLETGYTQDVAVQAGPDYSPVPIPGAALLLGSGLLGLIGIRRKAA